MAYHIAPNLNRASQLFNNATIAAIVQQYVNGVFNSSAGTTARILVAMDQTSTPWNSDDFNGFGVERAKMLEITKNDANNAIMIGGDLHDSWAWTMYEGGNKTGPAPVAVNLGCPGVSSPGWGPALFPVLQGLSSTLGGTDAVYDLIENLFYQQNPGLRYADVQNKGFFVVKATRTTHTVEYIHNSPATMLTNFSAARAANGKIVADFFCGGSLVTTAGLKGSLVKQTSCSAIQFDSSRPAVWTAPFPTSSAALLPTLKNCDFNACTYARLAKESIPPSTSPSRSPIKTPVKTPVSVPIPVPVPLSAPIPVPVKAPASVPVPVATVPVPAPVAPVTVPVMVPVPVPVNAPAPVPVPVPVSPPVPVKRPTNAPFNKNTKAPVPAPLPVPVPLPAANTTKPTSSPTKSPVREPCGIFNLSIVCLFSGCGFVARLFNIGDC
jgi:PhoD-like phosphatase